MGGDTPRGELHRAHGGRGEGRLIAFSAAIRLVIHHSIMNRRQGLHARHRLYADVRLAGRAHVVECVGQSLQLVLEAGFRGLGRVIDAGHGAGAYVDLARRIAAGHGLLHRLGPLGAKHGSAGQHDILDLPARAVERTHDIGHQRGGRLTRHVRQAQHIGGHGKGDAVVLPIRGDGQQIGGDRHAVGQNTRHPCPQTSGEILRLRVGNIGRPSGAGLRHDDGRGQQQAAHGTQGHDLTPFRAVIMRYRDGFGSIKVKG